MKTIACLLLSIVALACHGQERYVTLVLKDSFVMTNSFEIDEGETGHLVSMGTAADSSSYCSAFVKKEDSTFLLAPGSPRNTSPLGSMSPVAFTGPAKFFITGSGGFATFKITPNFSDPQKTIIVLPGAENAAQITLQCSTNLSTWVPATNGLYSGDVAKFFRIHLEKAQP